MQASAVAEMKETPMERLRLELGLNTAQFADLFNFYSGEHMSLRQINDYRKGTLKNEPNPRIVRKLTELLNSKGYEVTYEQVAAAARGETN